MKREEEGLPRELGASASSGDDASLGGSAQLAGAAGRDAQVEADLDHRDAGLLEYECGAGACAEAGEEFARPRRQLGFGRRNVVRGEGRPPELVQRQVGSGRLGGGHRRHFFTRRASGNTPLFARSVTRAAYSAFEKAQLVPGELAPNSLALPPRNRTGW